MSSPMDLFKCRVCGIKTNSCSKIDITLCSDCDLEINRDFKEVVKQ